MRKNIKCKNYYSCALYFFKVLLLLTVCFSCSSSKSYELSVKNTNSNTSVKETNKVFVPESIDISDVSGDLYKNTLLKIDELNHTIKELVYVTKEDYFEYKDVKVSLIGDSIAEFAKTYLSRCFRNIVQDSVSGREFERGIEAFDAMKAINRVGDIMIFSLGNNATRGIELDVLEHVYNGIEGRPLIILTVVMPYVGQERNRNRDLIEFVKTHENCYIADWNKVVRMSENLISEDGVHPTGDGCAAYAQLLLKTVVDIMKSKNNG